MLNIMNVKALSWNPRLQTLKYMFECVQHLRPLRNQTHVCGMVGSQQKLQQE